MHEAELGLDGLLGRLCETNGVSTEAKGNFSQPQPHLLKVYRQNLLVNGIPFAEENIPNDPDWPHRGRDIET